MCSHMQTKQMPEKCGIGHQRQLRGHPCKNQTKTTFSWQGSKIPIVSIFAHPSKTIKAVYFFPQMYFNFREKRTFRFHPLESMNRVITGRKLNTFARFAFQRYYVQGNLTNVSSFIDSLYSVKCKLCRNWLLRSFWPCEKAMCSLPLQKNVGEENLFVHHVP